MLATKIPLVYAVILNWNGKSLTMDCVESVLVSHYTNTRVLVIDNGSTDGSIPALRAMYGGRIEIIENKANLGYARGFNVGLAYAFTEKSARYCLVMNNDTIIDVRAVGELVKIAQTDDMIGFVTGMVYYHDKPNIIQSVGKKEDPVRWNGEHIGNGEEDIGQYDKVVELHFADDIFTLVTKRLYKTIGGYNPMFFLQGEEYDWQARAKSAGFKIYYAPKAKLWHKVSMTLGKDSSLKAYYNARNPMLVVLIHKTHRFFRKYFWHHLWNNVLRSSLVYAKHGRFAHALAKWRGLVSGIKWGLQNRRFTLKHFV